MCVLHVHIPWLNHSFIIAILGLKLVHIPIVDFTPPTVEQVNQFISLVERCRTEGKVTGREVLNRKHNLDGGITYYFNLFYYFRALVVLTLNTAVSITNGLNLYNLTVRFEGRCSTLPAGTRTDRNYDRVLYGENSGS